MAKAKPNKMVEFIEYLKGKGIDYHTSKDGNIIIIYINGNLDFDDMPDGIKIPEGIVFENEGNIDFDKIKNLPRRVKFNNNGYVSLQKLKYISYGLEFNNNGCVFLNSIRLIPYGFKFNQGGNVILKKINVR